MKIRQSSLSIVILNWNGTHDTLNCLASLSHIESKDLTVQIVVIDNGSDIDETPEIQRAFPETKMIRLPRNVGFAGGCNLGIREALVNGADYILFLNNDTEVEPNFLTPLIAAVQENQRIGLACSCIKALDESVEFAGANINFATGSFKHLRRLEMDSSPVPTEYVTGCSMLVPVRILKAIGTFDEKLFSYFEDTDLSLRAQRAGFETVLVPESVVRHKGSASTRRGLSEGTTSPLKHYLIARNRIVIVKRYAPLAAKWFYLTISSPCRLAFYTAAFVVRKRWTKLRWFWRGVCDGFRGTLEMPEGLGSGE